MLLIAAATSIPKNSFEQHWEANIPPTPLHAYIVLGILITLLCIIIYVSISHKLLKKDKFEAFRHRYEFRSKLLVKMGVLAFMIGLCETLLTLYRAFIMVAIAGNSDFSSYSGPVAETLFFTVLGLIVAIIAYCAHIYAAHKNMRLTEKIKTDEQLPE